MLWSFKFSVAVDLVMASCAVIQCGVMSARLPRPAPSDALVGVWLLWSLCVWWEDDAWDGGSVFLKFLAREIVLPCPSCRLSSMFCALLE